MSVVQPYSLGGLLSASFLLGISVGLTGMGSGALMTPFLILALGVRPVSAVGTDLVYSAITKIVAAWIHWRQGAVDFDIVRQLAQGSIPGAVGGALLASYMRRHGISADHYVRIAMGVVLVYVSGFVLVQSLLPNCLPSLSGQWSRRSRLTATITWGSLVGILVGLTSVGSGSLITPFLMILLPGKVSRVVGTDVFHAAILVNATSVLYIYEGQVEWRLVLPLLIGSLPGALLGARLATMLPPRLLGACCSCWTELARLSYQP
jgi:uncharacterized membrane protein YfcA